MPRNVSIWTNSLTHTHTQHKWHKVLIHWTNITNKPWSQFQTRQVIKTVSKQQIITQLKRTWVQLHITQPYNCKWLISINSLNAWHTDSSVTHQIRYFLQFNTDENTADQIFTCQCPADGCIQRNSSQCHLQHVTATFASKLHTSFSCYTNAIRINNQTTMFC